LSIVLTFLHLLVKTRLKPGGSSPSRSWTLMSGRWEKGRKRENKPSRNVRIRRDLMGGLRLVALLRCWFLNWECGESTPRGVCAEQHRRTERQQCGTLSTPTVIALWWSTFSHSCDVRTGNDAHHAGHKAGSRRRWTLRRCPSPKAIHGERPCRYPIANTFMTWRAE